MPDGTPARRPVLKADGAPERLRRAELIELVRRLGAENRGLRERLQRRRCGNCGAAQRWRAADRATLEG